MKSLTKRVGWRERRTAAYGAAAVFLCLGSAIAFIPITPWFPDSTLDSGWAFAINVAMAKGLVLGRDVVFTFGPYASIYSTQYSPATDGLMVAGGSLLAAAFAAGLLCLGRGGAMLASLGFALFMPLLWHDAQLFAVPLVMLVLAYRTSLPARDPGHIATDMPVKLALLLLYAALALLPLIKGTLLLASCVVLVLSCGLLMLGGASLLAVTGAALFAAALPLFWVLSRQPLGALPGFFRAQAPIIFGYTSAMGLHGPAWQILLYIGCCMVFALLHWRHLAARGLVGLIVLTGIALMLFLGFKEGFVRDDQHSVTAAEMLVVGGWIGLLLGRHSLSTRLALLAGLACAAPTIAPQYGSTFKIRAYNLLVPYYMAIPGVETRLFYPADLRSAYNESLAAIRAQSPLPALSGTTDIYSYGQSALLAAGLDWDPRPVLQTYSAYTPSLLRADAAHLVGPSAPQNIIFALQPFDGRLPALEDGASWPWLLACYQTAGYSKVHVDNAVFDAAILTRRSQPGHFILQPGPDGNFKLGSVVPLPPTGPAWAEITLKPSFAGKLLSFLYKPPALSITYEMPGGATMSYRYIAGMGDSGFLIAPVVVNVRDFVGLSTGAPGNALSMPYPLGFRLTVMSGPHWAWQNAYSLRLFTLRITPG